MPTSVDLLTRRQRALDATEKDRETACASVLGKRVEALGRLHPLRNRLDHPETGDEDR